MAKEPAYQSGFSRLRRDCSSRSRCSHQARWSVSSAAALSSSWRVAADARDQGLSVVQRLGGDLARVIDPHEGRGRAVGSASDKGLGLATSGRGPGSLTRRGAKPPAARRSAAPIRGSNQAAEGTGSDAISCLSLASVTPFSTLPRPFFDATRLFAAVFVGDPMKTVIRQVGHRARRLVLVDANGKTLGRLASQIAHRLKGKHKADYSPHVDMGDHIVVVVNAEKVRVTGRKLDGQDLLPPHRRHWRHQVDRAREAAG